jgi:beta-lactamase superfamily II metal-dependent hydrolase
MATKKRPRKRNNNNNGGAANGRQVRIRMYNVGFGDAFLVLVPNGQKERRILFDCGSVQAAEDLPMSSVVERIVRDVTDEDGVPRIDVVVCTHRHKDHVSGFGQEAWANVEVKEVWMPWTEHPTDPEARRIRNIQSNLALGLEKTLAAKPAGALIDEEFERCQRIVENALSLSNDKAMKTLHNGFSGDPERRFLPEVENARVLKTSALPGVKVHVLGPSRSRDIIRDMDPPKGESFLRMSALPQSDTGLPPAPFSHEFRRADYTGAGTLTQFDLAEIQRAGDLSELAVAVALDKAVNGTSLMLVLEVAGTYLLFPGDAQWGTWCAAMEDPEWREILGQVSFYKIGHHGSHNATPKTFVEKILPEGICAMASTLTRTIWPDIPRIPLLTEMQEKKVNIARSDQPDQLAEVFQIDEGVIETRIPL